MPGSLVFSTSCAVCIGVGLRRERRSRIDAKYCRCRISCGVDERRRRPHGAVDHRQRIAHARELVAAPGHGGDRQRVAGEASGAADALQVRRDRAGQPREHHGRQVTDVDAHLERRRRDEHVRRRCGSSDDALKPFSYSRRIFVVEQARVLAGDDASHRSRGRRAAVVVLRVARRGKLRRPGNAPRRTGAPSSWATASSVPVTGLRHTSHSRRDAPACEVVVRSRARRRSPTAAAGRPSRRRPTRCATAARPSRSSSASSAVVSRTPSVGVDAEAPSRAQMAYQLCGGRHDVEVCALRVVAGRGVRAHARVARSVTARWEGGHARRRAVGRPRSASACRPLRCSLVNHSWSMAPRSRIRSSTPRTHRTRRRRRIGAGRSPSSMPSAGRVSSSDRRADRRASAARIVDTGREAAGEFERASDAGLQTELHREVELQAPLGTRLSTAAGTPRERRLPSRTVANSSRSTRSGASSR